MRRTKIVCTLGPACTDPAVLKKMLEAGMNVARLNLSHGTYPEHEAAIKKLRRLRPAVAILADLQGPRIRTGLLRGKEVELKTGAQVFLTSENIQGDANLVPVSPREAFAKIEPGAAIMIADGTIRLKALAKKGKRIKCKIMAGGTLGEHKGVNLPRTPIGIPSLTAKDKKDIDWAVRQGIDFLALSFVRKAEDVLALKKMTSIPVIAKIEKAEAVDNLESIIEASDGIMVARGDLGVEMRLERVPVIQKEILDQCRLREKPVIVATQMLESMVKEPSPSRAEVSDVANAIFDGTDAVMLSEETSIGAYPVGAVEAMNRIALEAEKKVKFAPVDHRIEKSLNAAVAHAACVLANTVKAKGIITFTETGSTARRVSKQRPDVPIFGVVTDPKTLRRLSLYFGVFPQQIKPFRYIDEMILETEAAIIVTGRLKKDDLVILTAGVPINIPGTTNLIKVHKMGEKKGI